ncbi:MAG: hypothetical protein IJ529_05200 [Alphaproteobacteria bacterium]|nr:hypothetical protein [Alphaproteobacteria bacterium]MBQ8677844.1 hypothetical protein [Alphaproteobacteria bacterium]
MKVLIETIASHRGYKFFENCEEMDAYLGRHCGKIKINTNVADFCSYCFNINFIKRAACPSVLLFVISAQRKASPHRISVFPLILLSVNLTF